MALLALPERHLRDRSLSLLIYGAGGHAQVVADAIQANGWHVQGFCADGVTGHPSVSNVLAGLDELGAAAFAHCEIIVAIGSNPAREQVARRLGPVAFATVVHPTCVVSTSVDIGVGTFVAHGAIVGASTVLGRHTIVNTGAAVSHDCVVEDYAHIAPRATVGEHARIGQGALVGAAAIIRPGVCVGRGATVGAGTVVRNDVPDGVTVVGNPARFIYN